MHVYDVILQDETGCELTRSNFEAVDDQAARDLLAHYYADRRCEIWRDGRMIERHSPLIGQATA